MIGADIAVQFAMPLALSADAVGTKQILGLGLLVSEAM